VVRGAGGDGKGQGRATETGEGPLGSCWRAPGPRRRTPTGAGASPRGTRIRTRRRPLVKRRKRGDPAAEVERNVRRWRCASGHDPGRRGNRAMRGTAAVKHSVWGQRREETRGPALGLERPYPCNKSLPPTELGSRDHVSPDSATNTPGARRLRHRQHVSTEGEAHRCRRSA